MSQREENQHLLGGAPVDDDDSADEIDTSAFVSAPLPTTTATYNEPPPVYASGSSNPATLIPSTSAPEHNVGQTQTTPSSIPLPVSNPVPPLAQTAQMPVAPVAMGMPVPGLEAPPDYSLHAPKMGPKAGMAVQIQMDGRLVPATMMEDPSGRHMVYICEPQSQPTDGQLQDTPTPMKPPKDYLALSLLSLICCCCFPLGIIALLKSLEVQRRYRQGDHVGAARASKQAYSWGSAAVVFGVTFMVVVVAMKMYLREYEHNRYYYHY